MISKQIIYCKRSRHVFVYSDCTLIKVSYVLSLFLNRVWQFEKTVLILYHSDTLIAFESVVAVDISEFTFLNLKAGFCYFV